MRERIHTPVLLAQPELAIISKAINIFHDDLNEEIELSGNSPTVQLSAEVSENDPLAILITIHSSLTEEETKQHLEKTLEMLFQIFIGKKNTFDCYQFNVDETTQPPRYIISNIQVPSETHADFMTRAAYKCSPPLTCDELQEIISGFMDDANQDGLIELLLSYPYLGEMTKDHMKYAFENITRFPDNEQSRFLYSTLNKLKEKATENPEILKQMEVYLRSLNRIFEKLTDLTNKDLHENILYLIELGEIEYICNSLIKRELKRLENPFNTFDTQQLFDQINLLHESMSEKFIKQLIISAIKIGNLNMLFILNNQFPEQFNPLKQEPELANELSLKAYEKLPGIKNAEQRQFTMNVMERVLAGTGCINQETGILMLAARDALATNDRERHTIIIENGLDDIETLFEILSNSPHPIRQRFIVSGPHWCSYDVQIDADGKLSLLILDSLGGQNILDTGKIDDINQEIISSIKNRFTHFEVFIGLEKRQHDYVSCQVFSLDDTSHLYSVEDFLDPHIYPEGLFDYLRKNGVAQIAIDDISVTLSKIPLHLMRTMQSKKLLDIVQEKRTGETVLNKRGDSPTSFFETRQGYFTKKTSGLLEQEQNLRLEEKLSKMKHRCLTYVTENDFDTIKAKMRVHTLVGLRERLQLSIPSLKRG